MSVAQEPAPLWTPDAARIAHSNLAAFRARAERATGAQIPDYEALHQWSVEHREVFWRELWDDAEILGDRGDRACTTPNDAMPGAPQPTRFFPDARLNFAENLLQRGEDGDVALIAAGEGVGTREITRRELKQAVASFAAWMLAQGVEPGDRVAGVVPNTEHAVIAALAAATIGAVWSSCSPDFGVPGILDRFAQIEPTILIGVDGYRYGGKNFDIQDKLQAVAAQLQPRAKVLIPYLNEHAALPEWTAWASAHRTPGAKFERFGFDHPLYILFSSGTTGQPKCIVHGAGGTLVQHVKEHALHSDIKPGDRVCYFTTCGWMMWNWLISSLAVGATVVLYEGNPAYPAVTRLFDLADEVGLSFLGLSAGLIAAMNQAGACPRNTHALTDLRTIASTGSPLSDESFRYVYSDIKADVQLASISGGTDIVSCFVLGNPALPVYAGQIQCKGLGMAVDVVDSDGKSVPVGVKGELVCRAPFPSMPVTFWGQGGDARYKAAYFERFENMWHHGDYAEITPQGGVVIHGRSDATLNPGGVRIGTAEIYRVTERMPQIIDAAAIGVSVGGDVEVALFVVLDPQLSATANSEGQLSDALRAEIRAKIRHEASPRHVPKHVLPIQAIPKTRTGKIAELALKTWVEGGAVTNRNALVDAELFDSAPPALSA